MIGRQIAGFCRRELADLLRQPELIVLMVLGPFVVLLLFGAGYRNETISLRTMFVGPDVEGMEDLITANRDNFEDYVTPIGFGSDLIEATDALERGQVDLVVVFPDDPMAEVRAGRQAEVAVLHNEIDPIQQVAVEIATEVATAQVNTAILTELITLAQLDLQANEENIRSGLVLGRRVSQAVAAGDEAGTRTALDQADATLSWLESGGRLGSGLGGAPADEDTRLDNVSTARSIVDQLRNDPGGASATEQAAELNRLLVSLSEPLEQALEVDPELVTRPLTSDAESLLTEPVDEVDFFVPSALGLLLQHATVSLAALSLMRDRRLGLMEMYRAGPIGPGVILTGKYLAYLVAGLVIGALLLVATTVGLGVTIVGSIGWAVVGVVLSLAASLSLGFTVALMARSDVQAIQIAMLVLLAGLFFGGFFLDLDTLRSPVRDLAWLMPVTFTIRVLQDVMLRGTSPALVDLTGLGIHFALYAALAWWLLGRRLRVA